MLPPPNPPAPTVPRDDSLCESCGYSLRGLSASGLCPECGSAISESDPKKRTGLPWQNRIGIDSWINTIFLLAARPRKAFGLICFRQGNRGRGLAEWLYLLIICVLADLLPWATAHVLSIASGAQIYTFDMVSVLRWSTRLGPFVIIALTIIEAVGVTWVARRRGWRVPFSRAFSLASYAAIGWLPAMVLLTVVFAWYFRSVNFGWYPFPGNQFDPILLITIFMISILWFESLVWLGVRQVKFANSI